MGKLKQELIDLEPTARKLAESIMRNPQVAKEWEIFCNVMDGERKDVKSNKNSNS